MRLLLDDGDDDADNFDLAISFDHSLCLSVFLRRLCIVVICLDGDSIGCDDPVVVIFDALFESPPLPLPLILDESIFSSLLELRDALRHMIDI